MTENQNYNDGTMYLVYKDENGDLHYQAWQDVSEVGTLIEPDNGDDMEMVGWSLSTDEGATE